MIFCSRSISKLYIVLVWPIYLHSQSTSKSTGEIKWAIAHPVAAIRVKCIFKRASKIYNEGTIKLQLDNFSSGGKLDAFRHLFFMAAFSQKVGTKKLRKLGIVHEKNNYRQFLKGKHEEGELPDSLGSVMDLYNNEIGFKLGKENKKMELKDLSLLCVEAIRQGKALVMKRNEEGKYVDCSGNLVDTGIKKWGLKKCLVESAN